MEENSHALHTATGLDPSKADYEKLATAWHDGQKYNPATRHRRRLIVKYLKNLDFKTVLEIGSGQPYLPQDISKHHDFEFTGTDISKALVEENRKEFPLYHFEVLDIVNEALPNQYDLILASEVLEHVSDIQKSLENIAKMAQRYVLITVPSSKVYPIDKMIGHYRHYFPEDMAKPLRELGFEIHFTYRWGFPFHNLYKFLINSIASPEKMHQTFGGSEYSWWKKTIAYVIYLLFFLNINRYGTQLIVLAEKRQR